MKIEHEQGYLIYANNTNEVDYVACARVLAKSIRLFHPDAKICLMSNSDVDSDVFDIVKPFPYELRGGFLDDWQVFWGSPFRETIKLEADMIMTGPVDHWWTVLRHRDVVVAQRARHFSGYVSPARNYRKIFDLNDLPDLYNAVTYWRRSKTAQEFFNTVRIIMGNWDQYKTMLIGGTNEPPTTDVVYAMAAVMLGVENVTMPKDFPGIVHMKRAIQGIQAEDWRKQLVWEINKNQVRINTIVQRYPLHYHVKDFAQEIEEIYDEFLESA